MNVILLIIVLSLLSIFLLMLFSTWFMNYFMKKYIGNRHQTLEELLITEKAPQTWSRKFEKRMAAWEKKGGHEEKITAHHQQACKSYIRRLNKFVAYIQKTNLVQDEETRQEILSDLGRINEKWREMSRAQ